MAALNDIDWKGKIVTVRINGLDTGWCYKDVIALVEKGGETLDAIMIPKVANAKDVYAIDWLGHPVLGHRRAQEEDRARSHHRIRPRPHHIDENRRLVEADGDAAFRRRRLRREARACATTNIGGGNADYVMLTDKDAAGARERHWNDLWHYPLFKLVQAARAHGLVAIDGPFGDYQDPDGFRAQANRTAILGCEGKWAIHPSQVELCNAIFTPPEKEVARAQAILDSMKDAHSTGSGAASLGGVLIDAASIRQAEVIVSRWR